MQAFLASAQHQNGSSSFTPIDEDEPMVTDASSLAGSPNTQPVSSQDVAMHGILMHDKERRVYAKLEPLNHGLEPIPLVNDIYRVGRGSKEDLEINMRKLIDSPIVKGISKLHCTLERKDDGVWLTDNSSQGTYVNTELIGNKNTRKLVDRDLISMCKHNNFLYLFVDCAQVETLPLELTQNYLVSKQKIGVGACGIVVLAFKRVDPSKGLVLKIIEKTKFERSSRNQYASEALKREPNCLRLENVVHDDRCAYIVMPHMIGGDFYGFITHPKRNGEGLGEQLTKFYAVQLLWGLEYLHARKITHRDIKPENLLLADGNNYTVIKIADFGLSKYFDKSSLRTTCGTPAYFAPEIVRGLYTYTNKVDLWSLGVVLFTAISGYPPFSESYTDLPLKEQILKGRLRFTNQWKIFSGNAQTIIKSMLRVQVRDRVSATEALSNIWFKDDAVVEQAKKLCNSGDAVMPNGIFGMDEDMPVVLDRQPVDLQAMPFFSFPQ